MLWIIVNYLKIGLLTGYDLLGYGNHNEEVVVRNFIVLNRDGWLLTLVMYLGYRRLLGIDEYVIACLKFSMIILINLMIIYQ